MGEPQVHKEEQEHTWSSTDGVFSMCPFVRYTKLTIIENEWTDLAQAVRGVRAWNDQLCGSGLEVTRNRS